MFLLLTLNIFHTFHSVYIVEPEQVSVSWVPRKSLLQIIPKKLVST